MSTQDDGAQISASHPPVLPAEVEVLVVGAGISGVGAGVRLRRAGITDMVIIDEAEDVGGTWRANTYPGCQCDVPSRLYSFSFAPNPEWSRVYARQPEILDYVRDVARRFDLTAHLRFGVRMHQARWSPDDGRWLVRTSAGDVRARFLISAAGPWNEPRTPDVPGLASFPGAVFHSARWDHDLDLTGRRVAVLGSGASAVQLLPEIAPVVDHLHLFQRTAQWVLPKLDHPVPALEQWLMRHLPGARRAVAAVEYTAMEILGAGFRRPRCMRLVETVARAHLRATVRHPGLRHALTPTYTLGCKRILFSNDYYPALNRPEVTVHATGAAEVRGSSVVGADGSEAEVDTIVLGTGFHILDMPVADLVVDGAGRSLAEHWQGSPEAHLGTMTTGFPNAFLLLGPGLGTGHTSAFAILEAQLELVSAAITAAGTGPAGHRGIIEVRAEAQATYNAELQAALAGTVYNTGGCASYYLDENGRNSFSWPWSTGRLRRRVGEFSPGDYRITTAPDTERTLSA